MSERRIFTPRNIAVGAIAVVAVAEGAIFVGSHSSQDQSVSNPTSTGIVESGSFVPSPITGPQILFPTNPAAGRFNPTDSPTPTLDPTIPSIAPTIESSASDEASNDAFATYDSAAPGFLFHIKYPSNMTPVPGINDVDFQKVKGDTAVEIFLNNQPNSYPDLQTLAQSVITDLKKQDLSAELSDTVLANGEKAKYISISGVLNNQPFAAGEYLLQGEGNIVWAVGFRDKTPEELTPILAEVVNTFEPTLKSIQEGFSGQYSTEYGYSIQVPLNSTKHPADINNNFELYYPGNDPQEAAKDGVVIEVKREDNVTPDLQTYVTTIVNDQLAKRASEKEFPTLITLSGDDASTFTTLTSTGYVEKIDVLVEGSSGYQIIFMTQQGNEAKIDSISLQVEQSFQINQ